MHPQDGTARPLKAPDFTIACPNQPALWFSDLRGRVVHLVFAGSEARIAELIQMREGLQTAGAVSLLVASDQQVAPAGLCVANAPEIRPAYAIAAGMREERMDGMELLVDASGWLRDRWSSDQATGAAALLDHVRAVRSKAVTMPIAHAHAH